MNVQKNMKIKSYVGYSVLKANISAIESKNFKKISPKSFKD